MITENGGPAFPEAGLSGLPNGEFIHGREGMSLRDYFAAKALSGLISNMTYGSELQRIFDKNKEFGLNSETPHEYVASLAFVFADAMLAERVK